MKFLCHPVYKYLILIISQYLIFTYAMKVNESIDKILLVNIFMVFLIDLIIIDDYQEMLLDYRYNKIEKKKKKKLVLNKQVVDDNDFVSSDTRSIITEHFTNDYIEGHNINNNYSDNGIPINKYRELNNIRLH